MRYAACSIYAAESLFWELSLDVNFANIDSSRFELQCGFKVQGATLENARVLEAGAEGASGRRTRWCGSFGRRSRE